MGNKINFKVLKKEGGQSSVEYILLLIVVVAFVNTLVGSSYFRNFFGDESTFFQNLATGISHNYRYATKVTEAEVIGESPEFAHPSFVQNGGSQSRFFTYANEYPNL